MVNKTRIPIVWSIGHSDSSGGTGIQADIHTFHDFNVYGCNVITSIIAQNSFATGYSVAAERKVVIAQINALDSDLPASVIKLGMVPNLETLEPIAKYLADFDGPVIYDLELQTSENWIAGAFDQLKALLLPHVELLVANSDEAEALTDVSIQQPEDLEAMAQQLLTTGVSSVLITGARFASVEGRRFDYWSDGQAHCWVSVDVVDSVNNRGGGSTLSAALAAALAGGRTLEEAIVVAKAYVTRGIRSANCLGSGPGSVAHHGLPQGDEDQPELSRNKPLV